jgi:hypothetical protein
LVDQSSMVPPSTTRPASSRGRQAPPTARSSSWLPGLRAELPATCLGSVGMADPVTDPRAVTRLSSRGRTAIADLARISPGEVGDTRAGRSNPWWTGAELLPNLLPPHQVTRAGRGRRTPLMTRGSGQYAAAADALPCSWGWPWWRSSCWPTDASSGRPSPIRTSDRGVWPVRFAVRLLIPTRGGASCSAAAAARGSDRGRRPAGPGRPA